jgi:hypothetical protein
MFESQIRGGFSGVLGTRYVKANNKYLKDFNSDLPSNYLLYLDANNLYGWAMSQALPVGNFQWENPDNYNDIYSALKNLPENVGCILDVDLEYTDTCRANTFKFPLMPNKRKTNEWELSPYQCKLLNHVHNKYVPTEKLILDLNDKYNYILNDKVLLFYLDNGIRIKRVNRIISYQQSNWLASYIKHNTDLRTKATTNFEKDIWKLMNNSFYGKTVEGIRDRVDVEIVKDRNRYIKLTSSPKFKSQIE